MTREGFTIALFPDTQVYAKSYPEILRAQTAYIADAAARGEIVFAAHVGDVVDDNGPAQWAVASSAFEALDGVVPYAIAPGNHDYGPGGSGGDRTSGLDTWFPPARFGDSLLATFEEGRSGSSAHRFETPEGPWLALALELAPRIEVIAWAHAMLDANAGLPAIVITHAHLYFDGTRYSADRDDQKWAPRSYGLFAGGGHDGEALHRALLGPRSEIRMVFCGHVLSDGGARLSTRRPDGTYLDEILANYQTGPYGGEGNLRLVRVLPRRIEVRTYSPWRDRELLGAMHRFDLPR
jgi:hypothetical protein